MVHGMATSALDVDSFMKNVLKILCVPIKGSNLSITLLNKMEEACAPMFIA